MLKKCTGTRNIEGCGKLKIYSDDPAVSEFSLSNKDMCRECENEQKRKRYHGVEHQTTDDKMLSEISKSWR